MGTLFLPSLEEKRHILVTDVSQTEAEMFISNLDERVKASRSLSAPKATIAESFKTYRLLSELWRYDTVALALELATSDVPRHRGIRAVFVDEDTDTIIVGTTVVYSDKWAVVEFDDTTIEAAILDFED